MRMVKKAAEKYRELPLPLKAAAWATACQFLQRGVSILTSPFVARLLSTEEYGRASTFISWESLFKMLVTLSSFQAINYLCARHENKESLLASLTGFNITVSAIWGILLFLCVGTVGKATGLSFCLILCLFLNCAFSSFTVSWQYVRMYEYSYRITSAAAIISCVFGAFSGLLAILLFSRTAEARIVPMTAVTVIIGIVIVASIYRKSREFYSKDIWRFTFFFCVPLLPHYLSEIVLMNSDRIMIDRMCGSSDVAIYSVAYTVGSLFLMVANSINSAFAPYQCQKIANKEYKTLAKNTNYVIAFVAFCLCGVMLFGREIVLIFGGKKYIESISLIIPISLGVFFNYVFQLFARVQEYFEQKYTIVIASISCALLNIVLNYVFIGSYGYKAAAYTTFFCYFAFCFLHYLFYRMACKKYVGQEIYDIKCLLLISVCLIAASVLIGLVSDLYVVKYVIVAAALTVALWKRKQIIDFAKIIAER